MGNTPNSKSRKKSLKKYIQKAETNKPQSKKKRDTRSLTPPSRKRPQKKRVQRKKKGKKKGKTQPKRPLTPLARIRKKSPVRWSKALGKQVPLRNQESSQNLNKPPQSRRKLNFNKQNTQQKAKLRRMGPVPLHRNRFKESTQKFIKNYTKEMCYELNKTMKFVKNCLLDEVSNVQINMKFQAEDCFGFNDFEKIKSRIEEKYVEKMKKQRHPD